jgi:hypothetical protein
MSVSNGLIISSDTPTGIISGGHRMFFFVLALVHKTNVLGVLRKVVMTVLSMCMM